MIVKMIMSLTIEGSYEFNDMLLQKYSDTYKKRIFCVSVWKKKV